MHRHLGGGHLPLCTWQILLPRPPRPRLRAFQKKRTVQILDSSMKIPPIICALHTVSFFYVGMQFRQKAGYTTDDDVNPVCGTNTTCWPIDRQVAKWLPNVPSPPPAVAAARRRNLLLGAARPNVHHACGGVCVLRPPASSSPLRLRSLSAMSELCSRQENSILS